MKTNILIEAETKLVTALMVYQQFVDFEKIGEISVRFRLTKNIRADDLKWADIFLSVRSQNLLSTYYANICEKYGIIHCVLLDDNLFIQIRKDRYMKSRQKELRKILNKTDCLFVCNELLGKKITKECKVQRVVKTDTTVLPAEIKKRKKPDELTYKIVYYSNDGSNDYFSQVILPALSLIKLDSKVEVHCIGMKQIEYDVDNCIIKYIPHLSFLEFRKYLSSQGFSAGLAPLPQCDGFSEYKYINKYIEFSIAGIPGIYSDTHPYKGTIHHQQNGILTGNSTSEWSKAIASLVKDRELQERIVSTSQSELYNYYSSRGNWNRICSQFPEICKYKSPYIEKLNISKWVVFQYWIFWIMEKFNSVHRNFRALGIMGLYERIKEYFLLSKQVPIQEGK